MTIKFTLLSLLNYFCAHMATENVLQQMGDRISQHTELLALAQEQVDTYTRVRY